MPRKFHTPLYTVSYSEIPKIEPVKQKVIIEVKPMTIEKLIAGYKKDEEEEDLLPGFRYLKKMKNEFKKEHIKSVLKKY
jgi:hypothetical protein